MAAPRNNGSVSAGEGVVGIASGHLYIVSAPSGAGKTSLVAALLRRDPQVVVSISHTTRPPRPAERNGYDYYFVTAEHFAELAESGAFLEHAQVFDHHYATSRAAVERELSAGRDVVLEIDWQGAQQIRQVWPQAISVFILPPSISALRARLASRGQDSPDVIERRMAAARAEMAHWREYDYMLVNNEFDRTVAELQAIFLAGRLRLESQNVRLRALLHDLLS